MTPYLLLRYMSAFGLGLFCIGGCLFLLFVLYFLALGWLKQPNAVPADVQDVTPQPRP